jgi:type II secretory pathway component GspD/PulD (secretin)
VDPNNSDITLELHPQVVTFIGETDDTVKISRGFINFQDNVPQYNETWSQVYKVWMPILGRRELKTTVKVRDGETLVLGGMVDNKTETVYDRWPVLGDIPLIGRLFSSQYEKQENSSLLVFVTARLLDNNGTPIEQNVQPDIPDFRR